MYLPEKILENTYKNKPQKAHGKSRKYRKTCLDGKAAEIATEFKERAIEKP
jgi:hypothetical protein